MSQCYVGNLPADVVVSDLISLFESIGKVVDVSIKRTKTSESYAFIDFAEKESASQAVRRLDESELLGRKMRVELPFDKSRRNHNTRRNSGSYGSVRRYGPYEDEVDNRPRYVVRVSGLPPSGSWQDLKDHFREAGRCLFANVGPNGNGVVEYGSYEDAQHAIRTVRGASFHSHKGESARIELRLEEPRGSSAGGEPYGRRGSSRRTNRSPPPRMSRSERYSTHESTDNYSGLNMSPRRRDPRADPSDSFEG